jgi:hypothetical protein
MEDDCAHVQTEGIRGLTAPGGPRTPELSRGRKVPRSMETINMKTAILVITALLAPVSFASDSGRFSGGQVVEIADQPGCPIVLDPKRAWVDDAKHASGWHRLLTGDNPEDYSAVAQRAAPDEIVVGVAWKNTGKMTILAREFLWEAFNAFDEKLGERRCSYSKDVAPGKRRADSEAIAQLGDDVSYYRVSVSRVKFEDGTFWSAVAPTDDPSQR